jgi:putative Holliday junction resolvase
MGVVLALDVGDRRIGVAKSDALGMLASPLTTLERRRDRETCAEIARLVSEYAVETVVVGLPKMLNNTVGIQAEKVLRFVEGLKSVLTVPVVTWDERLTTTEATRLLRPEVESGRRVGSSKKRQRYIKANVDQVAATLLLESYLAASRGKAGA